MRHALGGVVLFVLFGCQSGAALGTPCARSSECSSPLVCRLGRCRVECTSARDCGASEVCLIDQNGAGACEIPAVDVCAVSCDPPLVCANGHCREPCADVAGCPGGHVCTTGACQRADLVIGDAGTSDGGPADGGTDGGVDAAPVDAGPPDAGHDAGSVLANDGAITPGDANPGDASILPCDPVMGTSCGPNLCGLILGVPACVTPSTSLGLREACTAEGQCARGLSCQGGRCVQTCYRGNDAYCGVDLDCAFDSVAFQSTLDTRYGIGLCTERCDPFYGVGCPPTASCAIGTGTSGNDFTWCREVRGSKQDGEACGAAFECAAGLDCYFDSGTSTRTCRRFCLSATGEGCPTGTHCAGATSFHGRPQVGACIP